MNQYDMKIRELLTKSNPKLSEVTEAVSVLQGETFNIRDRRTAMELAGEIEKNRDWYIKSGKALTIKESQLKRLNQIKNDLQIKGAEERKQEKLKHQKSKERIQNELFFAELRKRLSPDELSAFMESMDAEVEKAKNDLVNIELVNLTPHDISIFLEDRTVVCPASGTVARSNVKEEYLHKLDEIPVYKITYGEAADLPAPKEGVAYIVSNLTAQVVHGREDVFVPYDPVRDEDGRVIGCKSLARI